MHIWGHRGDHLRMELVAREGFIKNVVFFEKEDKRLGVEKHGGGTP